MKQTILSFALFLILGTTVFAQETSLTIDALPQNRQEIKERITQKNIELQSQIEQKRLEIKEQNQKKEITTKVQLQIVAQDRVSKIVSQIYEKLEAILVKFDGITIRIEARIQKLKDKGMNTENAEALLTISKVNIEDTTTLIAASEFEIQNSLETKTSVEVIKSAIEECKISLKTIQSGLVEVVSSLKILGDTEELSVE